MPVLVARRALGTWIAGLLIAATELTAAVADQSGAVEALVTSGPGVLTKCRYWLVATSCHHYHHVRLPRRIAVGDTINLTYGSIPKGYAFPVARIGIETATARFTVKHGETQTRWTRSPSSRAARLMRDAERTHIGFPVLAGS